MSFNYDQLRTQAIISFIYVIHFEHYKDLIFKLYECLLLLGERKSKLSCKKNSQQSFWGKFSDNHQPFGSLGMLNEHWSKSYSMFTHLNPGVNDKGTVNYFQKFILK